MNLTYFEIIPEDLVILIFYKLVNTTDIWRDFMEYSYQIKKILNKSIVAKNYLKRYQADWYDIIQDEPLAPGELSLRADLDEYDLSLDFLFIRSLEYYQLLSDVKNLTLDGFVVLRWLDRVNTSNPYGLLNIAGRYMFKKTFPYIYNKIKGVNIMRTKRGSSSQYTVIRQTDRTYGPDNWLTVCYVFDHMLELRIDKEIINYILTGKISKDYIILFNDNNNENFIMDGPESLILYSLFNDTQFNLRIQKDASLHHMLFMIWQFGREICEEVINILSNDILSRISKYIIFNMQGLIDRPSDVYQDMTNFILSKVNIT